VEPLRDHQLGCRLHRACFRRRRRVAARHRVVGDGLAFDRRGLAGWIGYLILASALAGAPLLAPLQGRGWATSEVFGIAPDPTAIATLGVLLLARGKLLPLLVPIPILWCLLSGMTLSTMGEPQAWAPYAALALTTAAWTWTIIRQHFNR
jgi:hypothetical protein